MLAPLIATAIASCDWVTNETQFFSKHDPYEIKTDLSGDGKTFALYTFGKIKIYDFESREESGEVNFTSQSNNALSMSADGKRIAVGDYMFEDKINSSFPIGRVVIYEKINNSWQQTTTITGSNSANIGDAVSISNDGKRVVSCGSKHVFGTDQKCFAYEETDDSDWRLIKTFSPGHGPQAQLSGDGKVVAFGSNYLHIISIDDAQINITEPGTNVLDISISHKGEIVAYIDNANAYIYNTTTQNKTTLLRNISDISVSDNGERVIMTGDNALSFEFDGGEWKQIGLKLRRKNGTFKENLTIPFQSPSLSDDGTKAILVGYSVNAYPFKLECAQNPPPSPKKTISSSSNTLRPPYWLGGAYFMEYIIAQSFIPAATDA